MGSFARATLVHQRARAHILAASDYSLVKEQSLFLRRRTARVHRPIHRRSPFQSPTGLVRGGGILSLIPPLSIGCPEDFRATFRRGRNDSQANDLRRKPSLSSECQKCCKSNKQPEPFDAAVQITTAGSRSSGRNQPNQLCSGRSYHPDQPCQAARILSLPGLDAPGCADRSITAGRQAGSVRGAIVPKGSPTTPGQALRRPGSRRALTPRASASGSVGAALEASVSQGTHRNFLPRPDVVECPPG